MGPVLKTAQMSMIHTGSLLSSWRFVTIHFGSGSHMLNLIKFHWRFPTRLVTLT